MNMSGRFRLAFITCCVLFISSAPTAAQFTKESQDPPFKIEVKVDRALVPVVVRDAQGRAVGDLRKEDFQIFDKDKPQVISGFAVEKRGTTESNLENGKPSPTTPGATPQASTGQPAVQTRFIVFLFDNLHLGESNLGRVQELGMKMISGSLSDSDMAAVVSISGTNSGLTRDRSRLEEAIRKLKSQPLYRRQDQCPDVDYYNADLIENKRNGAAFEAAVQETLACANLDPRTMRNMAEDMVRSATTSALANGDQDVRVTLATLREFVRRMASLPGQRTLILVSPGFLTVTPEAMTEMTQILNLAAHANVTISALDARGLYTTESGAGERGSDSRMAMVTGNQAQSRRDSMGLTEDVMAELADGSGGTYFHNSNDLEAGWKALTTVPEYVYVLELSLGDVKPDGTYHVLRVKVDRDGLKLQARRGYFAPKPQKHKK